MRDLQREVFRLWRGVDRNRIDQYWIPNIPRLVMLLAGVQWIAASEADQYVSSVVAAQGINPQSVGSVNPAAFTGVASDGRDLDTLLYQPVIASKVAISEGATEDRAMSAGLVTLSMIVATQVSDTFRISEILSGVARPEVDTYIRALNPPSCSRCVVLAGAYSWSTAYQRHSRCDCIAVPSKWERQPSGELVVPLQKHPGWDRISNADNYFASLAKQEQDRVFTKSGAQAIRDGANLNRVVNARRKAAGLTPAQSRTAIPAEVRAARGDFSRGRLRPDEQGRFLTAELTGRKQRVTRWMPETIYRNVGGNRDLAISLLRKHKYII